MIDTETMILGVITAGLVISAMIHFVYLVKEEGKRIASDEGNRESDVARVYYIYPDQERKRKAL